MRSTILSSYMSFLDRVGRSESAAVILDREWNQATPGGTYAQRMVGMLLDDRTTLSLIGRERLWAYLAARTPWSRQEELLLWRLVELSADQREQAWSRAGDLARDQHPSRARVLGWVMTRSNASAQAIPWLKIAWERLETEREREQAAFTLFEAYLDNRDWRGAEQMWPIARAQLTAAEIPDWLGRIAVAAARAGDRSHAMRLWKDRTNLDRASQVYLDDMLQAGLKSPLLEFYRTLAVQDADCASIAQVVQRIAR
jgi:hypothetical protein